MQRQLTRSAFAIAVALMFASAIHAQELPKEKGPARTVKMFDIFCLSQLPDLDGVAKVAGFGEFAQITGKDLERYQPEVPAEDLRAWRFHDFEAEYVLTAAKSKPDAGFKKEVPKFAKSTNFACSLLIPGTEAKDPLLEALVKLLGRKPDQAWDQGPMHVHAWSAQTDKLLSHVYYYVPNQTGPAGVLSASTFVLN
jgi:hypothetical protein